MPLDPVDQVDLVFSDWRPIRHIDDPLSKDLSAVARVGRCLFVACDETASVERLVENAAGDFAAHTSIRLGDFFDLPEGQSGEMDIEGLAAADGYLWIVGSHALKRKNAKRDEHGHEDALERMAEIGRDPNRYFLGRVPLRDEGAGMFGLCDDVGGRKAACLKLRKSRSTLHEWLEEDPHLAAFLSIPSKENGFDIEGIAVRGDRVWLGLRGPVLRGHAVVLELSLKEPSSGRLTARRIEGKARYRKHLLDTQGLGVRDLRLCGDDLLLLVGPTMALDGTALVLRWRDAVRDIRSGVVAPQRIGVVAELHYGLETDHPEGLEHASDARDGSLLVIYDAPGPDRVYPDSFTVRADIIKPDLDEPASGRPRNAPKPKRR